MPIYNAIEAESERVEHLKTEAKKAQKRTEELQLLGASARLQLSTLDQELTIHTQALAKLKAQQRTWTRELQTLARQSTGLASLSRAQHEALETLYQRAFLRAESQQSSAKWRMMNWVLSDKTAAEIQEEHRHSKRLAAYRFSALQRTKTKQAEIAVREQKAALFNQRLLEIREDIAAAKGRIDRLASEKAGVVALLETDANAAEDRHQRYLAQAIRAEETLKKLQANVANRSPFLADTDAEILAQIEASGQFAFPLSGPMTVTAGFHDLAYKEAFDRDHHGTDFRAEQGSLVLSSADGTVEEAADNGFGYSYVILSHAGGWFTVYGHLSSIEVVPGQTVRQGDIIGLSGGTPGTPGAGANTNGPHLHFEMYRNGTHVNPLLYLPPL